MSLHSMQSHRIEEGSPKLRHGSPGKKTVVRGVGHLAPRGGDDVLPPTGCPDSDFQPTRKEAPAAAVTSRYFANDKPLLVHEVHMTSRSFRAIHKLCATDPLLRMPAPCPQLLDL